MATTIDTSRVRRKDTTKGPPLRVLSLDGGGVRGYSMLIILQDLMYRSFVETEGRAPRRHEIPKPADYFDLIAGTGTGGLIAIMLGRLRLDVETCMDTYVRMTKRVFETDKTIAGIPYRSTLFKASKLEEAIKESVRAHTIFDDEGNDGTLTGGSSPITPRTNATRMERSASIRSTSSLSVSSPVGRHSISQYQAIRWGNPDASLYDDRENRTKTAVTAVFKGTPRNGAPLLLRSYDSRKEPPPEFNCTIWQAGRATSAIALAFKPIQIGQSVFLDEGAGKYNPAPQILEEAAVNEWPGREIGIFVSIGTGKRPVGTNNQQVDWWEGFVGGSVGEFAEARRRLIAKIEACEETHQQMIKEHLPKRGVPVENYCRLNVEVGVGEFGMNEWSRVADISTNTRRYLAKPDVQKMVSDSAIKIARIELQKRRALAMTDRSSIADRSSMVDDSGFNVVRPSEPSIAELPAELPGDSNYLRSPPVPSPAYSQSPNGYPYQRRISDGDKFAIVPPEQHGEVHPAYRPPSSYSPSTQSSQPFIPIPPRSERRLSQSSQTISEAPPLPPKTPIIYNGLPDSIRPPSHYRPAAPGKPPYPDADGPPPVNKMRKPEYLSRG